ncbi:MAG: DUF1566 domain-containing protein [Nitrospirae bacterium]|nr:DUF1566 domain-containing protein [Nitrospirota bacterium]
MAWPSPRFTNNGDGTVTDNLTGLMWTQDANLIASRDPFFDLDGTLGDGQVTWQHALDYVAKLNAEAYLGYTDWRLPNVIEDGSLFNAEQSNMPAWLNTQGFSNVQKFAYHVSSTSYSGIYAWHVEMWSGYRSYSGKGWDGFTVWPVRSGQSGGARLWETGQTTCSDSEGNVITCTGTGQDGEIKAGVSWPSPRFTVSGNCVIDNLTGLMWTKDARLPGTSKTWQQALDYANNLTLCGYTDWRLPDKDELMSLTDFSQYNPTLPAGHPFLNVNGLLAYWSSTSSAYYADNAFDFEMLGGTMFFNTKDKDFNVWPVRSGQVASVDLIVSILTTPWTTLPGQSILLSDTTKNQGTATAGDSTTKFYWSANAVLDNSDTLLGSRSVPSLAAGAISSGSTSVTVPSTLTCSGMTNFYIMSKADADGVVSESNETNNKRNRYIKVGPDMIIPLLTVPWNAGAGKTISIGDTTKNQGGCTSVASATKFYLSADNILDSGDTLLGSRSVPSLASGAASSGSTSVIIPSGTATGRYYIIAFSDADNVVAETFEGNNNKYRMITVP